MNAPWICNIIFILSWFPLVVSQRDGCFMHNETLKIQGSRTTLGYVNLPFSYRNYL